MSNNLKSSFKEYLTDISKYPLLTAEEEIELGKRIKEDNDQQAKETLITSNLRLVVCIAKKYNGYGVAMEDLVQEGNIGLIIATDKYDYKTKYRFSTCATPWIKQAITKFLTEKTRPVRLPAHIYNLITKMNKVVEQLASKGITDPTDEQIGKAMGIEPNKVYKLKEWRQANISLDTPLNDEEKNTIGDLIADTSESIEEKIERQELKEKILAVFNELKPRVQTIMKMRYGLGDNEDPEDWKQPHTLEDIGLYLGITRERVRQIEKETLDTLRIKMKGLV